MRKILITCCLFLSVGASALEPLATEATITRIANSGNMADDFYIFVENGNGLCNGTGILFKKSLSPSQSVHDRAFSLALTAYASKNKNVRVSGTTEDCLNGVLIELQ